MMTFLDEAKWHGKVFSGGWRAAGRVAAVSEPATGSQIGSTGIADAGDIAAAAERAAAAQADWAAQPHSARAEVMRRAAAIWREHAAEIESWSTREGGKVGPAAQFETHLVESELFEAAGLPSRPSGDLLPSESPRLSFIERVPVGVVGVIAPFNFPQVLAMRSVAPALALGNAVVLKPDPRTAVCGGVAIARVFEEAGLPDGVLSVLPGGADAGEALIVDRHVKLVSFTGSTRAGRRVGELAGAHLKRVHLELGGNSALIVLDDVDLDAAVTAAAWGSFLHQGQICMTTGRHLVHRSIYDEFLARLTDKASHLPVGNPATDPVALGPVIDAGQRDRIHQLVTASVDAGAKVTTGGTYDGLFYRPTVLADVTVDTPAYANEVFGPVAPVIRFESADDAAELAAASEYGLSLGILTKDVMRGLDLARRIPTGIVHINDQTVNDEANTPFGGVAASGTGARFGGSANIDAFTDTRWVTVRGDIAPYPF
jgi:benzaldehyde dehydrogenase (NAD)